MKSTIKQLWIIFLVSGLALATCSVSQADLIEKAKELMEEPSPPVETPKLSIAQRAADAAKRAARALKKKIQGEDEGVPFGESEQPKPGDGSPGGYRHPDSTDYAAPKPPPRDPPWDPPRDREQKKPIPDESGQDSTSPKPPNKREPERRPHTENAKTTPRPRLKVYKGGGPWREFRSPEEVFPEKKVKIGPKRRKTKDNKTKLKKFSKKPGKRRPRRSERRTLERRTPRSRSSSE